MLTPINIERLQNFNIQSMPLSSLSRWEVGKSCASVFVPSDIKSLIALLQATSSYDIPILLIGNGTNILFDDKGVSALIIKIGTNLSTFELDENIICADSGVWVPKFAANVARLGFTGIEHAIGIPGTLGGLICMNGGSQQKNISEFLIKVSAVNKQGNIKSFTKAECDFSYRYSVFQKSDWIITNASFQFPKAQYSLSRKEMLTILRSRRKKFPLKQANCGSVFKSNPQMYSDFGSPGQIIENLGFKNKIIGNARVSPAHANFIINDGNASSEDILNLINSIYSSVKEKYNYKLEPEVLYVTPKGEMISPILTV